MSLIDDETMLEVRALFDQSFDGLADIAEATRTRDHGVEVQNWVFPTGRELVPCTVQEIVRQPAHAVGGGLNNAVGDHTLVFPYGTPLAPGQRYMVDGVVYDCVTIANRGDGFTARVHCNRMG